MISKLNNFVVVFMASSLALFWVMYPVFGHDVTTEIASSLLFGASVTMMITWTPAAARALVDVVTGRGEAYQIFHIGFWGLAFGLVFQRVWATALRWTERPDWLVELPWGAFSAWTIACFSALILLSPDTSKGEVPGRNKLYVVLATGIGCLLAGITIGVFIARW